MQKKHNDSEFWEQQARKYISWQQEWHTVSDCDFKNSKVKWFLGGKLNAAYNCLDRHLAKNANTPAIIWEGNEPGDSKQLTYSELHTEVCKMAAVLTNLGIKAGDRVCIYMPMIPEIVVAMLATVRIGAVHSVVFAGFSPEALHERIIDCSCKVVITADHSVRGKKTFPLKENVDQALQNQNVVEHVIVIEHTGEQTPWQEGRDLNWHELMANVEPKTDYYIADANDPLFILYTSGSTGKPKGILHGTGGYMSYAAMTFAEIFAYKPGEVYWCTADCGWITGHSYLVYGPLANGATTLVYEGVPDYPTAARAWEIVDKHKVNVFYTAPTLIRALMACGDDYLATTKRDSLRILGSVGEPINPGAWHWYHEKVGKSKCPIVDTWWQTETGGILISPSPTEHSEKPGAATHPFPGIKPAILTEDGTEITGEGVGYLVIKESWPGQMQGIYGDEQRFYDTYFAKFPGFYLSGDSAKRDADGDYWIQGRIDDVLNVSGHRLGTAEIESALVKHPKVAEAAVVGKPDPITGESIFAFVRLMAAAEPSSELEKELKDYVAKIIGSFAKPKILHFCPDLPKTRSGKIIRRILRSIAKGETDDLGDTSTLANQDVVAELLKIK